MIAKVKIKDIKPNPFKKFINEGKLDESRVAKMLESIEHGTLPNSFFARKTDGKWELSHGHHRMEGFKEKHGKDFELNVHEVKYDDETMLVDMVRENLTHRDADFRDVEDSCVLARNWLHSKAQRVKQFDTLVKNWVKGKKGFQPVNGSYRDIKDFLSKQGKAISHETIRNYLDIHDDLDKNLHKKVGNILSATAEEKEDRIGVRLAGELTKLPKTEQMPVYRQIKEEGINFADASAMITKYKNADDLTKEMFREGKLSAEDLTGVQEEDLREADETQAEKEITFEQRWEKDYKSYEKDLLLWRQFPLIQLSKARIERYKKMLKNIQTDEIKTFDYFCEYKKKEVIKR